MALFAATTATAEPRSGVSFKITPAEVENPISRNVIWVVALAAMLGIALQFASYPTPGVLLAILLFGAIGLLIVFCLTVGAEVKIPIQAFVVIYGALMLWTGVAHVYAVFLDDYLQNASDASTFFELSRAASVKQTLEDLRIDTVGGLSVYVARPIYSFFRNMGFPAEAYIGTLWNTMLVAMCGAVMYAQVPSILIDNPRRAQRFFIVAYCTSGLIGMFGGLHLRDSYSLTMSTLLAVFWVRFLFKGNAGSVIRLMLIVIGTSFVATDIRNQSAYQVLGICLIGGFVAFLRRISLIWVLLGALLVLFLLPLTVNFAENVGRDDIELMQARRDAYGMAADSSSSLANRFVIGVPAPIRVVTGSIYVHIFPIPFWTGYNEESAYYLFKIFQAVWNFLLIPSFILGVWKLGSDMQKKVPGVQLGLFCLCAYLAGIGAVALTSLETRHQGQFLPLFIVVASIGWIQWQTVWVQRRRKISLLFASGLAVGYLVWAALKFR